MVSPDTITAPARPDVGEGDHDRYAHYVKKVDVLRSALDGIEIVALCGKRWIPTRDPERFPVCPTCKELHDQIFGSGDAA
jgi:hypothetical protein